MAVTEIKINALKEQILDQQKREIDKMKDEIREDMGKMMT